jgi:hypothetical protein
LPIVYACNFAYQAANGLQHAREHGMVHRDIKPANLILTRVGKKGVVKVLDFGLAKVTSEDRTDGTLTGEGQMLGTPNHVAPEQIRDPQSADIRADIYSLGCTLYHLIAGRPPFRGNNSWDVCQAHCSMEAEPLNRVRPEAPAAPAAVVATMMAKEPARRFQTPAEAAQALKPFFKQAAVRPAALSPDAAAPTVFADAATTQPASPLAAPIWPEPGRMMPGADGVAWDQLIEIEPDELLVDPVKPKPAEIKRGPAEGPGRRPPRGSRRRIAAVGATILVGLGAIFAIRTGSGRRERPLGTRPSASMVKVGTGDQIKVPVHGAAKPSPKVARKASDRDAGDPAGAEAGGIPIAKGDEMVTRVGPSGSAREAVPSARSTAGSVGGDTPARNDRKAEAPDDPIARALETAGKDYRTASEKARRQLLNAFEQGEKAPRRSASLEFLRIFKEQHQEFRTKGLMPNLTAIDTPRSHAAILKAQDAYQAEITGARRALGRALSEAAKAYAGSGKADRAGPIEDELRRLEAGERVGGVDLEPAIIPPGPFRPKLASDNWKERWIVGDPKYLRIERDGIVLSAGPEGNWNYLLTRRNDYRTTMLDAEIAGFPGTEAFMAIRMVEGDDRIRDGVTGRAYDEDGKIRAGWFSDLSAFSDELGERRHEFDYRVFFKYKFLINDDVNISVSIDEKQTASSQRPVRPKRGRAGIFVTSGSLRIRKLVVSD